MRRVPALLLGLGVLLSCGKEPAPVVVPEVFSRTPLEGARLARRVSLDLRGTLPSAEELEAVEADEAALDALIEDWLQDPRFEERLVALLAEQWHTRVDVFDIEWLDYPELSEEQEFAFERSVGEEPLRLMAWVVTEDRPWTEVVTAQHTLADPLLASIWPLEREDPAAEGWVPAVYTDGRPMSGVLSTNGLWWRYNTNRSNMNRKRAATLMDRLLCVDMLARPVSFSGSDTLADVEGTEDAVHSDPACLSCHSALDPVAATLFGFWWVAQYNVDEETAYHAERELLGPQYLEVEPAWFGKPLGGLADLGPHVAVDPRFRRCAVERFAQGLWRRPVSLADRSTLDTLETRFAEEDLVVRPLLAEILDTEAYRAASASGPGSEAENTVRMLSPEQLTGSTWQRDGFDQLANDDLGFRVLAGGVDGATVYKPQVEPGLTWALVTQRWAESVAQTVLADGGSPLATELERGFGEDADEALLAELHWRLLGVRADDSTLSDLGGLWTEVAEEHGADEAWVAVLTALLRDPLFLSY